MAGGYEARWRVKEWTKKFNPAVDNPTVAVPKPKPKGNEGAEVGGGDKHLGRVRVGEEPVPFLHKVGRSGVPMGDHEGSREKRAGLEGREGGRRESPHEAKEGGGKPILLFTRAQRLLKHISPKRLMNYANKVKVKEHPRKIETF